MAQFARPNSNVTQTSFTGGFAEIDEASASDADFAWGANNTAAVLEVGLTDPTNPASGTCTVRYRIAKTNAGTVDGAGNAVTVTGEVYQGAAQIATDSARTASGTWTEYSFTFAASAVTDWTDVRLRFTTSVSGGSPANRRGGAVSWAELETPDVATGGPVDGALAIAGSGDLALTGTIVRTGDNAYEDAIFADDPVFVASMEEASGNLVDLIGGKVGTASGSPTYGVPGPVGGKTAIDLAAVTDFFTFADHADLDLGDGPWTIELWFRRDEDTGATATLLHKGTNSPMLAITAADQMVLDKVGLAGFVVGESGTTAADGEWRHWAITRSGAGAGNTLIYKNGVEGHTDSQPATTFADTALGMIIGQEAASNRAGGAFAYIAIYKSVLSSTRVTAHFDAAGGTVDGAIAIAGAGSLGLAGTKLAGGTVAVDGTAQIAQAGGLIQAGAIAIGATGSIVESGALTLGGTLGLAGTGSLAEAGMLRLGGALAIDAAGSLSEAGGTLIAGAVALDGVGSIAESGVMRYAGALAIDGAGQLALSAGGQVDGTLALGGSGAMGAAPGLYLAGSAALAGSGSLGPAGGLRLSGAITLTGSGEIVGSGGLLRSGSTALDGIGSLAADGSLSGAPSSVAFGGAGNLGLNGSVRLGAVIAFDGLGTLGPGGGVEMAGALSLGGAANLELAGGVSIAGALAIVGIGDLGPDGSFAVPGGTRTIVMLPADRTLWDVGR